MGLTGSFGRKAAHVVAAALLLRGLIPLGYMPSALADGLPFVLCPDNLPAAFTAVIDVHGHDHAGHETSAVDQCDFGELAPDTSVSIDTPGHVIDVVPAVSPVLFVHLFVGRLAVQPVARGPPA